MRSEGELELTTFSPTDAALEGFRIAREKPRVLMVWAVVNLVISVVMALVLVGAFGQTLVTAITTRPAGIMSA